MRSINRSQLSGDKQHLLRHLSIIRHVTSNVSERNYGPSSEPVHECGIVSGTTEQIGQFLIQLWVTQLHGYI